MRFEDYVQHDGLGLAALVARREVSPAELLDTAIARAEAVNPRLNAIVRPLHERARRQLAAPLSGPFAGVPFLIKDLLTDLAGEPTSRGSRHFRDQVPTQDSELARRLQAAGLVIFGKTNSPELGLNPYTEPRCWGPTRNPWNLERTPGGSSGGSGAAVAAGIVPMAGAGDGGGSIRIPASCNGLVGFKPSRGLNPTGPVDDPWFGCSVEHPLTRSVRDTAALLDALSGPEAGAPHQAPRPPRSFLQQMAEAPGRLRIAYTARPLVGRHEHPDCRAGLAATVRRCQDLGHELVEAAPPIDRETFMWAFATCLAAETATEFAVAEAQGLPPPSLATVEPRTLALVRIGRALRGDEVGRARHALYAISRAIGAWFASGFDVLLTPTLGRPPFPIGELQPDAAERLQLGLANRLPLGAIAKRRELMLKLGEPLFEWIPNTAPFNVTGGPSVSLPLHWNGEGLPVGMMFSAPLHEDARLLQLAAQLEQAHPWFHRRPPL